MLEQTTMLDLIIDEFTVSSKKCRDVSLLLEVAEPLNLRAAYETRHPHDDLHRMLCGEGQPGHQQPAVACQLDVSAGCRKRRADRFGGCGSGRVFRQALDRRVVPMIVNLFAAADNGLSCSFRGSSAGECGSVGSEGEHCEGDERVS